MDLWKVRLLMAVMFAAGVPVGCKLARQLDPTEAPAPLPAQVAPPAPVVPEFAVADDSRSIRGRLIGHHLDGRKFHVRVVTEKGEKWRAVLTPATIIHSHLGVPNVNPSRQIVTSINHWLTLYPNVTVSLSICEGVCDMASFRVINMDYPKPPPPPPEPEEPEDPEG
jgi:hypothetical protein